LTPGGDTRQLARSPKVKARTAPLARRPKPQKPARARPGIFGRLVRTLLMLILIFGILGPIAVVAIYRFVPPPMTFL
jgi:hypothetical protein